MNHPHTNTTPSAVFIDARLDVASWASLALPGSRLVYAGQDAAAREALIAALGGRVSHVALGEAVNLHAEALRDEFINLDRHLDQPVADPLWQASDLAERNPFTSTLYQDACLYFACRDILRTLSGRLLVVVENPCLGQELLKLAKRMGWRASWRTGSALGDTFPWLIRFRNRWTCLRDALRCRLDLLKDFRKRKTVLARLGISRPKAGPQTFDTLLTVWAVTDTFPAAKPKTHDPYWGELPQYLTREGQQVLYLATPAAWVTPFRDIATAIAASPEAVVLPEQCQSLAQAAWDALRSLFWKPRFRATVILADEDLTPLVRDAVWQERAKPRQCLALQYGRVGPALMAWGLTPRQLLHLYENQPWEKCLRQGLRDALPRTRLTAFQHVPFSRLYLCFIPSRHDLEAGVTPQKLIVSGEFWQEVFLQAGYGSDQVEVGSALRFDSLFTAACVEASGSLVGEEVSPAGDGVASDGRTSGHSLRLLVAGGMDEAELRELLFSRLVPASRIVPELAVSLKFHPKMEPPCAAAILADLKQAPGFRFTLTEAPIAELLPGVDAVLYTSSGVCYEALGHGKHALYSGSDLRLDINKLDWFPDLHRKTRSPGALADALAGILHKTPQEERSHSSLARAMTARLFACPDPDGMAVFLGRRNSTTI